MVRRGKKSRFLFHPGVIFVAAQLAWLSLLGLWIYWYVSNYIIFNKVGDRVSPQLISSTINVIALVIGLVLLVAILVGMYLIFIYLNKQINLTKLYDNFIANVTHELKSPLASIQLHLETLAFRNVSKSKQDEFFELMLKDANRLKNRIDSILEISRLESKRIAHNFQVYEIEELTRALVTEAIDQFKLRDGQIKISGDCPHRCVVDRNALKIVFDNLIDNAIKYSNEPAQISIRLSADKQRIVLNFVDHGVGIPPKEQKKVLNKFHRVYDRHIPSVKGTGLGLYWVKEIVKIHGGKITVFSRGFGYGSTFRIELPIYTTSKRGYIDYLLKLTKKREEAQVLDYDRN